jgi:hypothetical protein
MRGRGTPIKQMLAIAAALTITVLFGFLVPPGPATPTPTRETVEVRG